MNKTESAASRNQPGSVVAPALELLLDSVNSNSIWPQVITCNPAIQREVKARVALVKTLQNVFDCLPRADYEIATALENQLVKTSQVVAMYQQLSDFLEQSEPNKRLLLYMPFELLPDRGWHSQSSSLNKALSRFRRVYLEAFKTLLKHHDVRASFNDGDILEPGLRTQPLTLVVKAAHLAPMLVGKGLISAQEIVSIIKKSSNEVLRDSLADAVMVMADLHLLSTELLNAMAKSNDDLLRSLAIMISILESQSTPAELIPQNRQQLLSLGAEINQRQQELQTELLQLSGQVSEGRIKWLCLRDEQKLAEELAIKVSKAYARQLIVLDDWQDFVAASTNNKLALLTALESLSQILQWLATLNAKSATTTYTVVRPIVEKLAESKFPAVQDAVASLKLKLSYLGTTGQPTKTRPALSFDLARTASPKEVEKLLSLTELIKSDKQLCNMLYPVLLVYGSRVKGYGTLHTDFDLAVFVRPTAGLETHSTIQQRLTQVLHQAGINGSIMEFYLSENQHGLEISEALNPDKTLGGSYLTHVLFEAAWFGCRNCIKQIFAGLLSRYLHLGETGMPQTIKDLLLSEIERNTLQYRLMHKGYAYLYPKQGGITTPHSSAIDSQSSFWDSGYRQLASLLFVKRVFLPQKK